LNFSSLPLTLPITFSPLSESSGVSCAFLSLSHPDSNDSSLVSLLGNAISKGF
jgi:hypothetical protein